MSRGVWKLTLLVLPVIACVEPEDPPELTRPGDLQLTAVAPQQQRITQLPATAPADFAISGVAYTVAIGGTGRDVAFNIAADAAGDAFVTVESNLCVSAPTSPLQTALLVEKLSPAGVPLYAACFPQLHAFGIAADSAGNAYISSDSLLVKLDPAGGLVYSVSLGQPLRGVTIDASGNAYVIAGPMRGNSLDIEVAKVNATGTALLYDVVFGSSNNEQANDIAVDSNGNAWIVGFTYAADSRRPCRSSPSAATPTRS